MPRDTAAGMITKGRDEEYGQLQYSSSKSFLYEQQCDEEKAPKKDATLQFFHTA
jgi:hypothetical protein